MCMLQYIYTYVYRKIQQNIQRYKEISMYTCINEHINIYDHLIHIIYNESILSIVFSLSKKACKFYHFTLMYTLYYNCSFSIFS